MLSNMGMATIFDYLILAVLRAYKYKPGFFKNKFFDEVSGAILSQAVYVPFTALFITAFKLNWKYKLFFSLYFTAIEKLFTSLGIFKSRTWRTSYTTVLIFFFFHLSDVWLILLKQGNSLIKKLTLHNIVQLIKIHSLFFPLEVPGILSFGIGRHHSWKEQLKVEPLYASVFALLTTWATIKEKMGTKLSVLFLKAALDRVLIKLRIIRAKSTYPLYIVDVLTLVAASIFKKWIDELGEDIKQ
ncbi:hypothetical protein MM300_11000 [Evansella sp. LMS18]|uniref:hypothetical protein n=1 Tax=Evansella sp. LMS18 TaxID=2924033 RepID=UPI0020D1CF7B|nr:hypothetical protein [Evansella sp. LMS18]UTR12761.1 hypothetical protein MM300_11000 [Evansella sp. LMS18]